LWFLHTEYSWTNAPFAFLILWLSGCMYKNHSKWYA
jgi:hypothetical protein